MSDKKIQELKKLVETAEIALQQSRDILASLTGDEEYSSAFSKAKNLKQDVEGDEQVIEGVFDGQQMVGPDGKQYSIPVNYASKSKLVEGDILKLTISADGTFVYKQIGPQDRDRVKGILVQDNETDGFRVMADNGRNFKLLTASVTYFKGESGDEVVVLIPKGGESTWAALENVVKKGEDEQDEEEDKKEELEDVSLGGLSEDDLDV
ncbi:MAG: hypothetical protein ABIA91_02280 [Patescibacteria group bacterium]